MNELSETITIDDVRIKITVVPKATRFGILYVAVNDFGEAKCDVKGYNSPQKALREEVRELNLMLA